MMLASLESRQYCHIFPDGSETSVAFTSKALSETQKRYSVIQKEALAIYFGVKHFYPYLYGRHFTLLTDHNSLF